MRDLIEIGYNSFPILMEGLGTTLILTMFSIVLGTILGTFLSLGKIYGNKIVSRIITIFIDIIRGTPLLAQLFILYFGLPPYGIKLSAFTVAVVGFSINSGCYQAEYLRASIESISSGQMRAALSIGLTKWQGIRYVILPQAFRRVIPSWTNEFIYLLKYTSLAYIIGAPELMAKAKFIASRNYEFFKVYLITGLIYLVMVILFTQFFDWVERKVKIPGFEYNR